MMSNPGLATSSYTLVPLTEMAILHCHINSNNPFKNFYQTFLEKGSLRKSKIIDATSTISKHDSTYVKQEMEIALVTRREFLIFATLLLPIIVRPLGQNDIGVDLDMSLTSSFFSYMGTNFKRKFENVFWVGILSISEQNLVHESKLKKLLFDRYRMIPILVNQSTVETFVKGYCQGYYERLMEKFSSWTSETRFEAINLKDFEEVRSQHWEINQKIAKEIDSLLEKLSAKVSFKNTLIIMNDYQLSLVPYFLYKLRTNSKLNMGMTSFFPFFKEEFFFQIPGHLEILDSMLLCDVISFNSHESAAEFIKSANKAHNTDYNYEKQGYYSLSFLGRNIIVQVTKISIDFRFISENLMTPRFDKARRDIQPNLSEKIFVMSINRISELEIIFEILNTMHNILQNHKFPEVSFCYFIKTERFEDDITVTNIEKINEFVDYLNAYYKSTVFTVKLVNECAFADRIILLKNADILIDFQKISKPNIEIYEFAFINDRIGIILCSNPSDYHRGISKIVHLETIEKASLYRILANLLKERCGHKSQASSNAKMAMKILRENVYKSDVWAWLETLLLDFKKSLLGQKEATFFRKDQENSTHFFASHKIFQLNKNEVASCFHKTSRRLIIISFEEVLENKNIKSFFDKFLVKIGPENKKDASNQNAFNLLLQGKEENLHKSLMDCLKSLKSSEIIKKIETLTLDPQNSVYILSSLPWQILEQTMGHIENIFLIAEEGFTYRHPQKVKKWRKICKPDNSWQQNVIEFMKSVNEKSQMAVITTTASSVRFILNPGMEEAGIKVVKELHAILKKELADISYLYVSIVRKKEVHVESQFLPKSYLLEIILYYEFLKKGKTEFFLGLLSSGFESIFVGLRKYINMYPEHFNLENIGFFPTKVGPAISHAKYFCDFEEIEEIFRAIEDRLRSPAFLLPLSHWPAKKKLTSTQIL